MIFLEASDDMNMHAQHDLKPHVLTLFRMSLRKKN